MGRNVPPVTSLVLDITRFALALTVAFCHWTQGYFQDAWPDLTNLAIAAVGGFFILSGYTIRLLTPVTQNFSGLGFFVERLSRLWSVALPALLLTLVLDLTSRSVGHDYYDKYWGLFTTYPLFRIAVNVGFVSQCWGWDIKPFSNSPFWSLSYEAGFYTLYGIYRALRGWRRTSALLAVSLLLGPNVILMLLVWLGGVVLYDVTDRVPRKPSSFGLRVATASAVAVAVAWFSFGPAPQLARELTRRIVAGFANAQATLGLPGPLRLDNRRIDGYLLLGAVGFWLLFAAFLPLCRELDNRLTVPKRLLRLGRAAGNFTFPLYLLHFPLFVLLGALGLYDRDSALQKLACLALVCAVIVAASPLFDVCKFALRRYLEAGVRRLEPHLGVDKPA
jgi:peptidoglycan/LPS O-acetylase OafA/YrhL